MQPFLGIMLRALIIAIVASGVGLGINAYSSRPLPWIYVPPKHVILSAVMVPLINEREAKRFLADTDTVFIDTRLEKDYVKSHIKGAVFLQPSDKEERFSTVEPFLPPHARLVLYCYGPECPMAEEVAQFLVQLGYKNMMIMTAGFRAWDKSGYPTEKGSTAERSSAEETD